MPAVVTPRLRHVPTPAEIAARIDAAREPWARLRLEAGEGDDELVDAPVSRRQRRRSLAQICRAARRAGADRVIVDGGIVIYLSNGSPPVEAESDVNEWEGEPA